MASLAMSKPLTFAVPEVGFKMVHSIEMVVVFPAPFGPNKPKISPDSTVMSSLSTAVSELNVFVSCLVSITLAIKESPLSKIGIHWTQIYSYLKATVKNVGRSIESIEITQK